MRLAHAEICDVVVMVMIVMKLFSLPVLKLFSFCANRR
jgi:hypothetical protein